MPETVTIDENLGIVRIESYGDVTAEDFKATLAPALRIHKERGFARGFVDATKVTSYPSTIPIYDFGTHAAESLGGLRIAIATPAGRFDDAPSFFETVARNRGAHVRVFDSEDAALAWLMGEPNSEATAAR